MRARVLIILADLDALGQPAIVPGERPLRSDVPTIAVLPFADMSPERSQEYFAEGIAEVIIYALTRLEGIRVVARTSSFALKGRGLDVREIGRVLNVEHVLEGSVRWAGNRLRITAQLIDVRDGFHAWSERLDREAGDVFAVQDEITASIVDRLAVSLRVGERAALRSRPRVNPEAYALFLKGRYFQNRIAADTVELALQFYGEAAAKDPTFALAHAGTASVWGDLASFNFSSPQEAWPKAREAAERALAIDRDVPEAHLVLGGMALWYDWDWLASEAANTRALALNPGDAFARGRHAWLLLNRCRFDECCAAIRNALACDPLSPILYAFSVGLHAACNRGEQALAAFSKALELAPGFPLSYFHAAIAYTSLGRLREAGEAVEAGIRQGLTVFWADCILGIVRAKEGRREEEPPPPGLKPGGRGAWQRLAQRDFSCTSFSKSIPASNPSVSPAGRRTRAQFPASGREDLGARRLRGPGGSRGYGFAVSWPKSAWGFVEKLVFTTWITPAA